MQRIWILAALLTAAASSYAPPASAHTLGEGYLFINIADDSLDGWFEITLTDLDTALDLDADGDGRVVEAEIDASIERIQDYLGDRVGLGDAAQEYPIRFTEYEVRRIPISQYLAQYFVLDTPAAVPDEIRIRYEVLFDRDPDHRGFLVLSRNDKTGVVNKGEDTALRFGPDRRVQSLDVTSLSMWRTFATFVKHGIWHIWIGIDHILFLIALILPSVLVRRDGEWLPVADRTPAMWNVVKIITLFTIAHTITLSLAALDVVSLPPRLVESVIAASVVLAAANNIYPIFGSHIGWVVFGFGLFHGFGFASVLSHLVTNRSNLVVDLLGFNVGVELGQIAIILLAFPVLSMLRHTFFYRRVLLPAGSLVIGLLAAGWLVERAFEVEFLPI